MQFVPALSADPRHAARERAAASHLPYTGHVDDATIELKDGRLMQVIKVGGLLFETLDSAEIDYRKAMREAILQSLGSSRFAVYHHVLRRCVTPRLDGDFADPFSRSVDAIWRGRLGERRMFVNEQFLVILRRPATTRARLTLGLARAVIGADARATERAAELRALTEARDALMATLGPYDPRLLHVREQDGIAYSEPLEYLSALYNGDRDPVSLRRTQIADYLPKRRISFGAQLAELGDHAGRGRRYVGMVSVKDYPGATAPGMLDALQRLPFEMTITQSFAIVDRSASLGRINLTLRRMRAADDEAIGLREELALARDEVASGRAAFGEHHLTVALHGASPEEVDAGVAEVQAAMTELGMAGVREDTGLEAAFWAQMPGNFAYIARRALISTRNFASLASLHDFPQGQRGTPHWGSAITVLETTAAGPYHFNFHAGDLGNFTVIGPSGSGKTVVINFLLAQAQRLRPRVIFFDKDRGAEVFLRAMGGHYDVLRPGTRTGLNPLMLDDTPANRRFLTEWIGRLVAPGGGLLPAEIAAIKDAVETSMAAPPALRRLSGFAQLLRGSERAHPGDLAARLAPWCGSGEHAWLFDNAQDGLAVDARIIGFDMTRLLDDPVTRTPAMMYLFHRVEERLDGYPTIIVVDEGWKALDDDVFVERIRDWEKTIRKRNGIVGFATQSAEDALSSRIASSIVEQAATQIFMPNRKARPEQYCAGFGLTPHECELIRTLPDNAHAFLVKHGQDSVVARLDLSGERDLIAVLSGREATVRRLDRIRERVGDDPARWMPLLLDQPA